MLLTRRGRRYWRRDRLLHCVRELPVDAARYRATQLLGAVFGLHHYEPLHAGRSRTFAGRQFQPGATGVELGRLN